MSSCRKVTELLSQQLDRNLHTHERVQIKFHLAMCAGCRNIESNMAHLREIVSAFAAGGERSDGFSLSGR